MLLCVASMQNSGYVHGDIKLANCIFGERMVKLIDLEGKTRSVVFFDLFTGTGLQGNPIRFYTKGFTEDSVVEKGELCASSDLYSLGVTGLCLYFALTEAPAMLRLQ